VQNVIRERGPVGTSSRRNCEPGVSTLAVAFLSTDRMHRAKILPRKEPQGLRAISIAGRPTGGSSPARKEKPATVSRRGLEVPFREAGLALLGSGVHSFLQLALFFLFLFLELVAHELKNRHFRAIAHTNTRGDNARVAAGTVGELRSDVAE